MVGHLSVALNRAIYDTFRPLSDAGRGASDTKSKPADSVNVSAITVYRAVTALDMTRAPDAGRSLYQLGRLYMYAYANDPTLGYSELYAMQKVFEKWDFPQFAAGIQRRIAKL